MPALNLDTGLKQCSACKVEKHLVLFDKNSHQSDGYNYECKECKAERRKLYTNSYTRAKAVAWNRLKNTGFTQEEYDQKLAEQGGVCAICGTDDPGHRNWNADHDHITGQKRGLLCNKCNLGIGHLNDDPITIKKALDYINHYTS